MVEQDTVNIRIYVRFILRAYEKKTNVLIQMVECSATNTNVASSNLVRVLTVLTKRDVL